MANILPSVKLSLGHREGLVKQEGWPASTGKYLEPILNIPTMEWKTPQ